MANLFEIIKRHERERHFAHIDFAQPWGHKQGFDLRGTTHPDKCPDFRVVTKPPAMDEYVVQWRKTAHSDWVTVYSNIWHWQCAAWIEAQRVLWPQVRLRLLDRSI